MPQGEIVIHEDFCQGCGYCQEFCSRGCLVICTDRFNPKGNLLPAFVNRENCTGCGICGWMCPHMAIEVYRFVQSAA